MGESAVPNPFFRIHGYWDLSTWYLVTFGFGDTWSEKGAATNHRHWKHWKIPYGITCLPKPHKCCWILWILLLDNWTAKWWTAYMCNMCKPLHIQVITLLLPMSYIAYAWMEKLKWRLMLKNINYVIKKVDISTTTTKMLHFRFFCAHSIFLSSFVSKLLISVHF